MNTMKTSNVVASIFHAKLIIMSKHEFQTKKIIGFDHTFEHAIHVQLLSICHQFIENTTFCQLSH